MIQQPPVQTLLNVQDGLYGLRYLKIVKSPTGPHYIVDVMFTMGLRLTADVLPGQDAKLIGKELDNKLQTHRPGEYREIKPAVDFVSDVAIRVLSDEFGQVAERKLREEAIKEAWEMTLFRRFLKGLDPRHLLEYEEVLVEMNGLYGSGTGGSSGGALHS
jgi:hypothetical protein